MGLTSVLRIWNFYFCSLEKVRETLGCRTITSVYNLGMGIMERWRQSKLIPKKDIETLLYKDCESLQNTPYTNLIKSRFCINHFNALTFSPCLRSQFYQWKTGMMVKY
jgi:hypothetical protein